MRILVVEDSERLAETLRDALIKANNIVDSATDGEAGYEHIMSGIYDVIILDLMLPKLNGYEVLKRVRGEGNNVPVIILSAKNELEDKFLYYGKRLASHWRGQGSLYLYFCIWRQSDCPAGWFVR